MNFEICSVIVHQLNWAIKLLILRTIRCIRSNERGGQNVNFRALNVVIYHYSNT